MKRILSKVLYAVLALSACGPSDSRTRAPVIDMHLHAFPPDFFGVVGPTEIFIGAAAPTTAGDLLQATLAALREDNVVKAVVSGPLEDVYRWTGADPDRFIGSPIVGQDSIVAWPSFGPINTVAELRTEYQAGRLGAMGEIVAQYGGVAPNDPVLAPYFALAAELDIPVLIHTAGLGAPSQQFRSALGNPLLLEEVVARHPRLRIYVENSGYPFLSEMVALMTQYPQVYGDLSTILRIVPVEEFRDYLRGLLRAGLGDRLMFGSDQGIWPDAIGFGIDVIEAVPFLTADQKRDILYNNAARFLRLSETQTSQ